MSPAAALLKTIRPHQWVKNVFVAAALVFSQRLTDAASVARTIGAIAAFCLVSGAVYAFNDVRDVEADRLHPTKKKRPIASGALSVGAAMTAAYVLAAIAITGACLLNWRVGVIAAVYLVQNVAYSVRLKNVAYVDVVLITSGFLLRVLAGAAAIGVPASGWILLCTGLLATFLGLGKRAHELAWAQRSAAAGEPVKTRRALAGYNIPVVRTAMAVLGLATCGAYVAYTLDPHTVEMFHNERLAYSVPFVAIGIARFMGLSLWWPKDEPPTEAMLRDPWFLGDLVAASAAVLYIIYG